MSLKGRSQPIDVVLGPKFKTILVLSRVGGGRGRGGAGAAPAAQGAPVAAPPPRGSLAFEPMAGISNSMNLAQKGLYKELQTIEPGGFWEESFGSGRKGIGREGASMMVRTIRVVTAAAAVSVGLAAVPSAVEEQQQPPAVPSAAPTVQAGDTRPIHVYIRAGLKSHGEGAHDYPQFIADWSKLLTDKGALVDGSFHFPTAQELATTDVMVMYKGDAGYMTASEKQVMEDYLKRGGGLISIHDTLCGDDPQYYSTIVGGSKLHGERNFSSGAIKYTIVDKASPIMKGISDFEINDEAFFKITWAKSPEVKVLATAPMPAGGEVVPQMWTYERTIFGGQPFRAFVWMQGHTYTNFKNPAIEGMLLRAIAWAAHYPAETLVNGVAPVRGGGRGRRGLGGGGETPAAAPAGRRGGGAH
jgi:type 1 glutamine amidotransferase